MSEISREAYRNFSQGEKTLDHNGLGWGDLVGKRTLDIGAGDAEVAKEAKARGIDVTALDYKLYARRKWTKETLDKPVIAHANQLPFDDKTFDLAISTYGPLNGSPLPAIREAVRVLKPGGELRYNTPCDSISEIIYASGKRGVSVTEEEAILLRDEESVPALTPVEKRDLLTKTIERIKEDLGDSYEITFVGDPETLYGYVKIIKNEHSKTSSDQNY